MLIVGRAWQMELTPYFNKNAVPSITFWWLWMPLQADKISIGTQTGSGSTLINIPSPWYAKIDAQQVFCFMILPVRGTRMNLAVSIKAKFELYADAQGTLVFDKYEEWSSKNHERTRHDETGSIDCKIKLRMLLLLSEVIMKNKDYWELSALASSGSLDGRTAVES